MQNPSQGVAQPLQNHVHLISGHPFPLVGSLNIEQAFRYLLDAPSVVKAIAPMAWTYVQAPPDGTLWLEWLPHNRNDNRFPSDGYVWVDQEQAFRQEFGGYTIEILQHTNGYRPQGEAMACHSRTRYHFVAKNPSVNAAVPDPSLWIVHYHQAQPQQVLPVHQVPPHPQMQQILSERRWLESQGRLEKKNFMLHDSEHWPQLDVPKGGHLRQPMQQPGFYGASPGGPGAHMRQPSFPQPGGYPQQPPQKKQRQQPPPAMPGPNEGVPDTSIEDEENTTLGDYFDHLTPRDISVARYTQHHRWMEEVFSSPYASSQIVPADLGLGLMGELRGLTEGILEPPSLDALNGPQARPQKPTEAQPFTNLKKEQLEEFNKRVAKHLEDGQAEIERMKAEHAAKMQEWKKTKILTQAEKRLRNATWEGHESAVPVFRLEEQLANGKPGTETVEDVVKEVESALGIKIASHEEANMLQKGGLEEEPERPQIDAMDESDDQQKQDGSNSASESVSFQQNAATPAQESAQVQQPAPGQTQTQPAPAAGVTGPHGLVQSSAGDLPSVDLNDDTLMGDVDLDMDTGGLEFDTNGLEGLDDVQSAGQSAINTPSAPAANTAPATNPAPAAPAATAATAAPAAPAAPAAQQQPQAQPQQTQPAAPQTETTTSNMFPDTTFDDLTGGDDGLIDFEGGMGMDDSAFGDALHGMEGADGDGAA